MGNKTSNTNQDESKTNASRHLVLLGDSVLDNFYWLDKQKEDVEYQMNQDLKKKYKGDFICTNLALDETESKDIFGGKVPGPVYVKERSNLGFKDYQIDDDGVFRPLNVIPKISPKPTHALLSIGGNDGRVIILTSVGDMSSVVKKLLSGGFESNYAKAVDEVLKLIPNTILVVVYRPGPGFMVPLDMSNRLYEALIPIIFKVGRERNLPIIDLSRTFNPLDTADYGSTPIEPSNKSGQYICDLTMKVLDDFKFGENESKIYYGKGKNIVIDKNEDNYDYGF